MSNYSTIDYYRLPKVIASSQDMTSTTKIVYSLIYTMQPFNASNAFIESTINASEWAVKKAITSLKKQGYIFVRCTYKGTRTRNRNIKIIGKKQQASLIIPSTVFCSADITHTDKIIYGVIAFYSKSNDGLKLRNDFLAQTVGMTPRTVITSMKRLEKAQFIATEYTDGERIIKPKIAIYSQHIAVDALKANKHISVTLEMERVASKLARQYGDKRTAYAINLIFKNKGRGFNFKLVKYVLDEWNEKGLFKVDQIKNDQHKQAFNISLDELEKLKYKPLPSTSNPQDIPNQPADTETDLNRLALDIEESDQIAQIKQLSITHKLSWSSETLKLWLNILTPLQIIQVINTAVKNNKTANINGSLNYFFDYKGEITQEYINKALGV